jgi:hypothetical protein
MDFTLALLRMSKHTIGTKEAAVLFLCMDGATSPQVARITGCSNVCAAGRINVLRAKKLLYNSTHTAGFAKYYPTERGRKIIDATLNQTKP